MVSLHLFTKMQNKQNETVIQESRCSTVMETCVQGAVWCKRDVIQ